MCETFLYCFSTFWWFWNCKILENPFVIVFEVSSKDTTVPHVKKFYYAWYQVWSCSPFLAGICKNVNRHGRRKKSSASEMHLTQPVHQDTLSCQTLRGWKLSRCSRKVRNCFRQMLLGTFIGCRAGCEERSTYYHYMCLCCSHSCSSVVFHLHNFRFPTLMAWLSHDPFILQSWRKL